MIKVSRSKLDVAASVCNKVFGGGSLANIYGEGDSVALSVRVPHGSLTVSTQCVGSDDILSHRVDASVFSRALKRLKGKTVDLVETNEGEILDVACSTGEHSFGLPHADQQLDMYTEEGTSPFAHIGTSEGAFVSAILAAKAVGCSNDSEDAGSPVAYMQGGTIYATDGSMSAVFSSTCVPKFPVVVPLDEITQYKRLLGKSHDELSVHVSMERLSITAQDSTLSLAIRTLHDEEITPTAGLFGDISDADGRFMSDAETLGQHVRSALLVSKELLLQTSPNSVGISAYGDKGRYIGAFDVPVSCLGQEATTHRVNCKRFVAALNVLCGDVLVSKVAAGVLLVGRGTVGNDGDIKFVIPYASDEVSDE